MDELCSAIGLELLGSREQLIKFLELIEQTAPAYGVAVWDMAAQEFLREESAAESAE